MDRTEWVTQCDQMVISFLSICSNGNVPKSIEKFPEWVQHFAKNKVKLQTIAKGF